MYYAFTLSNIPFDYQIALEEFRHSLEHDFYKLKPANYFVVEECSTNQGYHYHGIIDIPIKNRIKTYKLIKSLFKPPYSLKLSHLPPNSSTIHSRKRWTRYIFKDFDFQNLIKNDEITPSSFFIQSNKLFFNKLLTEYLFHNRDQI